MEERPDRKAFPPTLDHDFDRKEIVLVFHGGYLRDPGELVKGSCKLPGEERVGWVGEFIEP